MEGEIYCWELPHVEMPDGKERRKEGKITFQVPTWCTPETDNGKYCLVLEARNTQQLWGGGVGATEI